MKEEGREKSSKTKKIVNVLLVLLALFVVYEILATRVFVKKYNYSIIEKDMSWHLVHEFDDGSTLFYDQTKVTPIRKGFTVIAKFVPSKKNENKEYIDSIEFIKQHGEDKESYELYDHSLYCFEFDCKDDTTILLSKIPRDSEGNALVKDFEQRKIEIKRSRKGVVFEVIAHALWGEVCGGRGL